MYNTKIFCLIIMLFLINTTIIFSNAEYDTQDGINPDDLKDFHTEGISETQSITLYPTDDAYQSSQAGVFGFEHLTWDRLTGNDQKMNVGMFSNIMALPYESWAYIRFNLSQIPGSVEDVTSAVLRLYKHVTTGWGGRHNASAIVCINLHELDGPPGLDETTVKQGAHHPMRHQEKSCSYCYMERGTTNNGWKEWDVTSCIQNNGGQYGWVLIMDPHHLPVDATANIINFFTKEWSPYIPELIVRSGGEPPDELSVKIVQPENMFIYSNGQKRMRLPFSLNAPVAVLYGGNLEIKVEAYAPSGIDRVEFHMGDMGNRKQDFTDYSAPYTWFWSDARRGFNIYELNVEGFDNTGASAEDNFLLIRVW